MNIKVVVGANYGDEGKGTIVARLARAEKGNRVLNVLTNGGSQRGHSVKYNGEKPIIFHHFGAATIELADSYFPKEFIVNPMSFTKEYFELGEYANRISCFMDGNNLWTTPYDMMANQIIQKKEWTGSCGMGIWETILRNKNIRIPKISTFVNLSKNTQINILNNIINYYEKVRKIEIPAEYKSAWSSPITKEHFIKDCQFFVSKVKEVKFEDLKYDTVIFESGQGLLLGDTGKDDKDATPSITGISGVNPYIKSNDNVEYHYVTRSYITRHGSDNFNNNIELSKFEKDDINVYNEFQHNIKFNNLDLNSLEERIMQDYSKGKNGKLILDVTHCDEIDKEKEFKELFSNINFYGDANI